jgi:hypothetical protein
VLQFLFNYYFFGIVLSQGVQVINAYLNQLTQQYKSSASSEFYRDPTRCSILIDRINLSIERAFQGNKKEDGDLFSEEVQDLINLKRRIYVDLPAINSDSQEELTRTVRSICQLSNRRVQNVASRILKPDEMIDHLDQVFERGLSQLKCSLGLEVQKTRLQPLKPTLEQSIQKVLETVNEEDEYELHSEAQSLMKAQEFPESTPVLYALMDSLLNSITLGVYGEEIKKIDMLTQEQFLRLLLLEGARTEKPFFNTELAKRLPLLKQIRLRIDNLVIQSSKSSEILFREMQNCLDLENTIFKDSLKELTLSRADETFYLRFFLEKLADKVTPIQENYEESLLKFIKSVVRYKAVVSKMPHAVDSIQAIYKDVVFKGSKTLNHLKNTNRIDLIKKFKEYLLEVTKFNQSLYGSDPLVSLMDQINLFSASITQRGKSLREATQRSDLEEVKRILREGVGVSTKDRGWIVVSASYDGRIDLVKELLSIDEPISKESLGWAVIGAVTARSRDTLIEVLKNGDITEDFIAEALKIAVLNDDLEIVQELLKSGNSISFLDSRDVLKIAVKQKNDLILNEFLKETANHSLEYRKIALQLAIKNSNINHVQRILEEGPSLPITFIGLLVRIAARENSLNILQLLLRNSSSILEADRERAFTLAMKNNHEKVLVELLKGDPHNLGLALKVAVKQGDFVRAKSLLQKEALIPQRDINLVINLSAESGYYSIIRLILKSGYSLSKSNREEAIKIAKKNGQNQVASYLLSFSEKPKFI